MLFYMSFKNQIYVTFGAIIASGRPTFNIAQGREDTID